jgi:DNA helicase-2/ATP-dependent DNA helicase PcrA
MDHLRGEAEDSTLTELAESVIKQSGYGIALEGDGSVKARGKLDNIQELLSATREYEEEAEEPSIGGFLENVALLASADMIQEGVQAVVLMTLHSAKGLEFPVVFVVGMEEGLFPIARSSFSDDPMELEEERRLCYVGITRAQERLFLSSAESRTIFGATTRTMASRFLQDIPDDVVEPYGPIAPRNITWEAADSGASAAARQIVEEAGGGEAPFQAGDRVRHDAFGRGMVVSVSGSGKDLIISVAFPSQGIKKLDLAYAKLEKLD